MKTLWGALACLASTACLADQDEITTARYIGDAGQFVLPLGALSVSFLDKNPSLPHQFARSIGTTLGIAYTLKFTVNERRPNGGDYSFPSGHTSAAFAGAACIQQAYGWSYGIPAYLAASYVGWSRVANKAHWTQDVIAGAALGLTVNYYSFNDKHKLYKTFRAFPIIGNNAEAAVLISYTW